VPSQQGRPRGLASSGAAAFVRATHHPVFRPVGPVLFDVVLRRALNVLPGVASPSGRPEDLLGASRLSIADVRRLSAAVVDQLWRLYGPELSAAAERVFAAALPEHG
jgi:hypothetical protein